MSEDVTFPRDTELMDPAADAARQMVDEVATAEGLHVPEVAGISPEARLAEGLGQKLYEEAVDLGERTLPLGTQQPYVELPYYELPGQKIGEEVAQRTLRTRSLSFDPRMRGVTFSVSTPDRSRVTELRTTDGTPAGSFRAETDVEDRGAGYKMGLDYIASDPSTQTPGQAIFFDTRFMGADQTHLPHDDPHRQDVLDQLLVDIQSAENAVAQFEVIEANPSRVGVPANNV